MSAPQGGYIGARLLVRLSSITSTCAVDLLDVLESQVYRFNDFCIVGNYCVQVDGVLGSEALDLVHVELNRRIVYIVNRSLCVPFGRIEFACDNSIILGRQGAHEVLTRIPQLIYAGNHKLISDSADSLEIRLRQVVEITNLPDGRFVFGPYRVRHGPNR